jgi:hypothetical protein
MVDMGIAVRISSMSEFFTLSQRQSCGRNVANSAVCRRLALIAPFVSVGIFYTCGDLHAYYVRFFAGEFNRLPSGRRGLMCRKTLQMARTRVGCPACYGF